MRYLIDFSYSGMNFSGYQKQKNLRTVQGEIESVLTSINNNKNVVIYSSGRTDRGVNALHQMAHFDMDYDINLDKLKKALNSYLPDDIYINKVLKVPADFHARYMALEKTYEYKINMGLYNPLTRGFIYQYGKKLDIALINDALKYFKGKHDFTTFVSAEDKRSDKVRCIYSASLTNKNDILTITFTGSGFLKYQVRNMAGLLIKIGEQKERPENIPFLLNCKDRTKIGLTAPACGLCLKNVKYKNIQE